MNPVLEEIINLGTTKTIKGETKKVVGQIRSEEGLLIEKSIQDCKAEVSIEVGLAFGTSALYICEALVKTSNTRHYVIDPYQMYDESYGGIGLNNLKKSGFENFVEFINKPSHLALAELEQKNVKADFAFIDGWHTFDYALVDFFLTDRLLKVGGIMIIDDTDWPAINKVAQFIINNCSYTFIGGTSQRSYLNKNKKNIPRNIFSRLKNNFSNKNETEQKLYGAMAFKKTSDDIRSWDHYVTF